MLYEINLSGKKFTYHRCQSRLRWLGVGNYEIKVKVLTVYIFFARGCKNFYGLVLLAVIVFCNCLYAFVS